MSERKGKAEPSLQDTAGRGQVGAAHLCVKLALQALVGGESTAHVRGNGGAAFVLNATARHAEVLGVKHHRHVVCAQEFAQRFRNLAGQTLLHLGPLGVVTDNAIELAQTNHALSGDVGHVGDTHDGQEVMLAGGVQRDVSLHEHVVVVIEVVKRLDVRVICWIESPKKSLLRTSWPRGEACQKGCRPEGRDQGGP